ncbi:MAG: biopolymer transporter ExbD [Verrucomicrobiota bacterium]|jgi:biopolymer transport protein ExbD|nr:biopolymer transporter ExbD [Verrucomicrobiota bacterium]
MKLRRNKLLAEPPAGASSDIAFILIVFFLVCASVQPEQGRPQEIPKTEEEPEKQEKNKNPEVELTRTVVILNGDPLKDDSFQPRLNSLLADKREPGDRVVMLKSRKDVSYERWILFTGLIEKAGGIVTLQLEEEQVQVVN